MPRRPLASGWTNKHLLICLTVISSILSYFHTIIKSYQSYQNYKHLLICLTFISSNANAFHHSYLSDQQMWRCGRQMRGDLVSLLNLPNWQREDGRGDTRRSLLKVSCLKLARMEFEAAAGAHSIISTCWQQAIKRAAGKRKRWTVFLIPVY